MSQSLNKTLLILACCIFASCFNIKSTVKPQSSLDKLSSQIYIDEDSLVLLTLEDIDYIYKSWKIICMTNKNSGSKKCEKTPISESFLDGRYLRVFWIGNNIREIQSIKNDKLNGFIYEFYNNGKYKRIAYYKDNKLNGAEYSFDSKGRLWLEINYKDGLFHGVVKKYFYNNGALMTEDSYVNGLRDGEQLTYFKSGKVLIRVTYHNDKPDGVLKVYSRCGKVKKTICLCYGCT